MGNSAVTGRGKSTKRVIREGRGRDSSWWIPGGRNREKWETVNSKLLKDTGSGKFNSSLYPFPINFGIVLCPDF